MNPAAGRRNAAILTIFAAACVGIFLFLLNLAGGLQLGHAMRFQAVVRNAVLLADHADVRIAGVTVGRVERISLRGGTAVLDLSIQPGDVTLHRDAHVRIATKTPTGENYVDLDPGTPNVPRLTDGDVVALPNTRTAVQIDQLLSTLPESRRERLRQLVQGLGAATGDHADHLNGTLEGFSAIFRRGAPMAQALAGQRDAVAGLVDDLGSVMAALGQRDAAVRSLVHDGADAATAVASESTALRGTLRALPGTLTAARATTEQLASTGSRVRPVLDDLSATLTALTPAARQLPGASAATLAALRALRDATPRVSRTLTALRRTAPSGTAIVKPADEVLRQARQPLDYNARFTDDITRGISNLASAVNNRDGVGNLVRLSVVVTDQLYQALGPAQQKLLDQLAAAGVTRILHGSGFNSNPEPGRFRTPNGVSTWTQLQADRPALPPAR